MINLFVILFIYVSNDSNKSNESNGDVDDGDDDVVADFDGSRFCFNFRRAAETLNVNSLFKKAATNS